MESEITVQRDTAKRIKELWQHVEENRDSAVAAAGLAARNAIELGQILAGIRDLYGHDGWERWMVANVPEIPIPKATRLATIGPKYKDMDPSQLEFKTVKELYQATDILPPAPPSNSRGQGTDTNWVRLVEKLEAMLQHLNEGQKELLRKALVKLAEEL